MTTESRSSTPNAREWDEEEEQGPRGLYRGEQRGEATHRRWRRSEWDTQMVHAVGISTTMVCFLRERRRGKIKESRGGPLDEAGVRAVVPTKGKKWRGRGSGTKDEVWESRADRMLGKRSNAQCTKTASTARCRGHAKTGS